MTILAIHRKEPHWPADPLRPIFQKAVGGTTYYVETDGAEPTAQEIDALLNPKIPTRSEKLERLLLSHGLTKQDLQAELGVPADAAQSSLQPDKTK